MIDDPYLIAHVMHALANMFGVCHSVSVAQADPTVERCVVVPLFGGDGCS